MQHYTHETDRMDPNGVEKFRPLEKHNFSAQFKSLKELCTELAMHERRCEEKLKNIKHLHYKMLDMMKDHVVVPVMDGTEQHTEGTTEELSILSRLQSLIEQNRSLEEKNQRLEKAIEKFKEKFETILK